MHQELDLNNWNRKNQFDFFKDFEDPFFNITADVKVDRLYGFTKKEGLSFFLSTLYFSTKAANQIPEFRYRISGGKVFVYDHLHCGSTIFLDNQTFSFCYFQQEGDLRTFCKRGRDQIAAMKAKNNFEPRLSQEDIIHYSVLPWIKFTGIKHARKFRKEDSIPKIVFGKYKNTNDQDKIMPVSLDAHHALMDGYHAAKYFELFQQMIDNPVI